MTADSKARDVSELNPYCGPEQDRRRWLGESFVTHCYGDDLEAVRTYRFNALGFRGDDYRPQAARKIFVFGESHSFGYFLHLEDAWPYRFARRWEDSLGLARGEVNVVNFAEIGASNAYIARTLISQCSRVSPDLVLVQFAESRRTETLCDGRPVRLGPWHLDEPARKAASEAEPEQSEEMREVIARAEGYFRFAAGTRELGDFSIESDAKGLLETVQNILLVQYFSRALGITAVASCAHVDRLFAPEVRRHETFGPILNPLVDQVDRTFLCDFDFGDIRGGSADDDCHAGPDWHDRFARAIFDFFLNPPVPRLAADPGSDPATEEARAGQLITREVRAFYQELPFNQWADTKSAAESLRENVVAASYPDLDRWLRAGETHRVVELGCGSGWLTNSLAFHYGVHVEAIDFSERALARARDVATRLALNDRTVFRQADIFSASFSHPADLVVSLGVLHHTHNVQQALERAVAAVSGGGALYLGLYHGPGRAAFRRYFDCLLEVEGEEAAFEEFRRLIADRSDDEIHQRSWFRDQVMHPHESSHTLEEVAGWLADLGFEVVSTSLNRFRPFLRLQDVTAKEHRYQRLGRRALRQGRFFPGFFTVLALPGLGEGRFGRRRRKK